jgi:UDP-glucose 4-epimerase
MAGDGIVEDMALRYFVTGCAGFIGSTLTERLLQRGHEVVGYDNFSTGRDDFLQRCKDQRGFRLVRADLLDGRALQEAMRGAGQVFHLAANADVRFGTAHPRRDLEQNTIATHHVLEAMRANGVNRIAFTSTGSIYGETALLPTPEDAPFPVQTSLYAASKLAAEGMIGAYCTGFGFQAHVFRLVSILGERYTHGHVIDFYRQLRRNPAQLRVLGDGHQRKSYLYVHDCIDAMQLALERSAQRFNLFNLGTDGWCEVRDSVSWICAALGLQPRVQYGSDDRGWAGDNPFIHLDTARIRALGWRPTLSIRQAVERTLDYLRTQPELLEQAS